MTPHIKSSSSSNDDDNVTALKGDNRLLRIPLQSKTKTGKTEFVDMPNFKKKLYFSYIRMSTGKQTQEHSPERQRDYLKLYTKKIGIDYDKEVIEFKDPGESGFKVKVIEGRAVGTKRKEFAKMWEYIQACKVPCEVFVYDISRYSRHDQIGVQELSIALGVEGKEHQKIEKFHIAETEEVYTIDTPGSIISGAIRAKMQESEGKRRKSNSNILIWTDKKMLPKMVASKLSSTKIFEWVVENGIEGVRKGPNFVHLEKAIDMRIEGRTIQEIHEYLSRNGVGFGIGNLSTTIFTNSVFEGVYCPKKGKNRGEVIELQFLDCETPISTEKWRKLQETMKHRAPYRSKQLDGAFLRPVIHIMRYVGGKEIAGNFRFYSKTKGKELYWYIRYRKGHKTLVTISLLEILREFIKQQGQALYEVFYNISKSVFEEMKKEGKFEIDYIPKINFGLGEDIEMMLKKDILHVLPKNIRIDGEWRPVDFQNTSFIEGINMFLDYFKSSLSSEKNEKQIDAQGHMEYMIYVYKLVYTWACCYIGEEDMKKLFLKNLSVEDMKLIENGKVFISHMKHQIEGKEKEIIDIDDRIIDGLIKPELLPRAEERKNMIQQEIDTLQEKIGRTEKSTEIEKNIQRLPAIIRKIGELTKKPFMEKDFGESFSDIVKLLEITCGELLVTQEKTLQIKLYGVLESLRDIDNLNWQDDCLLLANFIENFDRVKDKYGEKF